MLAINDFSSARKRMSMLVRSPAGGATLFVKGADDVVYNLLASSTDRLLEEDTQRHLVHFASQGLRTLVLAQRDLSAAEYAAWAVEWHAAETASAGRAELI